MTRPILIALLALGTAAPAMSQPSVEKMFSDAESWTVVVRTTVDLPFIEDSQGSSIGSGFVVDAKRGWILTNAHVTSRSRSHLSVSFRGGKPRPVKAVYVDPYLDLAVLALENGPERQPLKQAPIDCMGVPPTGHAVGAFGHPWRYYFTGTRGITSAMTTRLGPDMLQTDAPINEGNSGGALISLETGKVIGVNTAVASDKNKRADGIGFAVPMVQACQVLDLLRSGEDPSPPDFLVDFAVGLEGDHTLTVAHSRLPAGSIELKPGDALLAVGGKRIATQGQLVSQMRGRLDGLAVTVERDGELMELTGTWPAAPPVLERAGLMVSGALIAESPSTFSAYLNLPATVMVHHVEAGSEAGAAELEPYDIIARVNGKPVEGLAGFAREAERARATGEPLIIVLMTMTRRGTTLFDFYERELSVDSLRAVGPLKLTGEALAAR